MGFQFGGLLESTHSLKIALSPFLHNSQQVVGFRRGLMIDQRTQRLRSLLIRLGIKIGECQIEVHLVRLRELALHILHQRDGGNVVLVGRQEACDPKVSRIAGAEQACQLLRGEPGFGSLAKEQLVLQQTHERGRIGSVRLQNSQG